PGAAGDEILPLGVERVAAGLRAVDPGIAQNLAAGGRAAPGTLVVSPLSPPPLVSLASLCPPKIQRRLVVRVRLLDVGNMRGVENGVARAGDFLIYSFASGGVAGSCLPAMTSVGALILDKSSRWSISRTAAPQAR